MQQEVRHWKTSPSAPTHPTLHAAPVGPSSGGPGHRLSSDALAAERKAATATADVEAVFGGSSRRASTVSGVRYHEAPASVTVTTAHPMSPSSPASPRASMSTTRSARSVGGRSTSGRSAGGRTAGGRQKHTTIAHSLANPEDPDRPASPTLFARANVSLAHTRHQMREAMRGHPDEARRHEYDYDEYDVGKKEGKISKWLHGVKFWA